MDDIADILASVSGGPSIPHETLDLQALTRAWVNERTAPELLPDRVGEVQVPCPLTPQSSDGEGTYHGYKYTRMLC